MSRAGGSLVAAGLAALGTREGTDCGHYNGSFNDADFEDLLRTLASIKGKFMLTMFPHPLIEKYAAQNGWTIHRIERTITASKVSRRRQEEWIVTNYPDPQKDDSK